MTTVICFLLSLITLKPPAAHTLLFLMQVSGLYLSYFVVTSLLLWRRLSNTISLLSEAEAEADATLTVNTIGAKLVWGPFHVPGIWGALNNIVAAIYSGVFFVFCAWPPVAFVDLGKLGFAVVATGAVIVSTTMYYFWRARYMYSGPVIEIIHC
ncbi:hypothetical protein BJX99DRAFT_260891 [Aspergillus californicus]